jgi:hypothetical protein
MAYTTATLALAASEALRARGMNAPPSLLPRIAAQVPAALELTAKRIAEGPGYRGLQKDFDATPTAGVYDTSTAAGMLFDIHRSRIRVTSSGATLQAVDDLRTLEKGSLPPDSVYYALDGGRIVFRSTTGLLNDYATAVKIRANFVPTLAEATTYGYDGTLLETLVGMFSRDAQESAEMAAAGRTT